MSSILTNNGAMVALSTLRSISSGLADTQKEISTGLKIGSAADNAAVWSISQVMSSDADGFTAISESLTLGNSTVAVARQAAESITSLLGDIKTQVISAQETGNDKDKIQSEISALRDQVSSIVSAAQFKGVNLLQGSSSISILSSLDRSEDGSVKASHIKVGRNDLAAVEEQAGTTAVAAGALMTGTRTGSAVAGNAADPDAVVSFTAGGTEPGATYTISLEGTGAAGSNTGGAQTFTYVANDSDTEADVSNALKAQMDAYISDNSLTNISTSQDATTGALTVALGGGAGTDAITVGFTETTGGTVAGGLSALASLDVTTEEGATQALTDIEALINTAIDAAASFGSVQGRINTQSDFVSSLTDSLKSGIGALVDANMEAASARLQSLQVQQQLGIQSLSIANQAPQSILSLFG